MGSRVDRMDRYLYTVGEYINDRLPDSAAEVLATTDRATPRVLVIEMTPTVQGRLYFKGRSLRFVRTPALGTEERFRRWIHPFKNPLKMKAIPENELAAYLLAQIAQTTCRTVDLAISQPGSVTRSELEACHRASGQCILAIRDASIKSAEYPHVYKTLMTAALSYYSEHQRAEAYLRSTAN